MPVAEFVAEKARAVRRAGGAAAALERRLHPHEHRPASPARRRAAVARVRARGATSTSATTGLVLRRLRARSSHPDDLVRRTLPGAPDAAGAGRRRRTSSSASRATRTRCVDLIDERAAADRAGAPAQRGRSRSSGAGSSDFSVSRRARARARLGHPRCRAIRTRSSTSGSTRSRTTSPRWATARTSRRLSTTGGARADRARPRDRQGHHALPRGLLAGDAAVGAGAAADDDLRPRLPDRRRAEDHASRSATRSIRSRSPSATAPTPCAGGCSATCRGRATPTSAGSWSPPRGNELADGLGNLVNRTIALVGPPPRRVRIVAPAEWPAEDGAAAAAERRAAGGDRRRARAFRPARRRRRRSGTSSTRQIASCRRRGRGSSRRRPQPAIGRRPSGSMRCWQCSSPSAG